MKVYSIPHHGLLEILNEEAEEAQCKLVDVAHGRLVEEGEEDTGHAGEEDMDDELDRPDEEWV